MGEKGMEIEAKKRSGKRKKTFWRVVLTTLAKELSISSNFLNC